MNIVRLSGGIGNQVFQISFALAQKKNGIIVKLDDSFYQSNSSLTRIDKLIELKIPYATPEEISAYNKLVKNTLIDKMSIKIKMLIGLKNIRLVSRGKIYFHQGRFNLFRKYWAMIDNVYFDGTFMNRELIYENLDQLKYLINGIQLDQELMSYIDLLSSKDSVAIHIRRGDYLSLKEQGFIVLSEKYYQNSINIVEKKIHKPHYYVFSNEKLEIFPPLDGRMYSFINLEGRHSDLFELLLMSKCSNFIIANSSYSLIAAYISSNENKIIVGPYKWMKQGFAITKNILPKNTIIVKSL